MLTMTTRYAMELAERPRGLIAPTGQGRWELFRYGEMHVPDGNRVIDVEFVQDDLRTIRAPMDTTDPDEAALSALVLTGLARFEQDEASWQDLHDRDDPAAAAAKDELKRRETAALLMSMRSRTIRSEMHVHDLASQVQALETSHADSSRRARSLRRVIAHLRRRAAGLETARARTTAPGRMHPPSIAARLIRLVTRRHG